MTMRSIGAIACAALAVLGALPAAAAAAAQFEIITFRPRAEAHIVCPATLECDISLEPGEVVHDGFAAAAEDFNPHATYVGPKSNPTPHLVFLPTRPGLHTNVLVPTSRRIYYFDLVSTTAVGGAHYYAFAFPKVFISRAQTGPKPVRIGPLPSQNPMDMCVPEISTYTFRTDSPLPLDHATGAQIGKAVFPPEWRPAKVCTDGRHTLIEFVPSPVVPDDTPILSIIGPDGDTTANYTYDSKTRRFRIDGVPQDILLELGSQTKPIRLTIHHDFDLRAYAEKAGAPK